MHPSTIIFLLASGICAFTAGAPNHTVAFPSASHAALASRKGVHHLAPLRRQPSTMPLSKPMNISTLIKHSNVTKLMPEEPVISTTFVALLLEHIKESTLIPFQAAARVPRSSSGKRQHYCGNVLKEVLRLICDGKYYSGHNGTRSRQSSLLGAETNIAMVETVPVGDAVPVASPREVTSSLLADDRGAAPVQSNVYSQKGPRKSRPVRGVVDECCRKPCTVTDLRMYCMID